MITRENSEILVRTSPRPKTSYFFSSLNPRMKATTSCASLSESGTAFILPIPCTLCCINSASLFAWISGRLNGRKVIFNIRAIAGFPFPSTA